MKLPEYPINANSIYHLKKELIDDNKDVGFPEKKIEKAVSVGTNFWKQVDIEVAVCCDILTVGSAKDGCELLCGGFNEEVWVARWVTWNEE